MCVFILYKTLREAPGHGPALNDLLKKQSMTHATKMKLNKVAMGILAGTIVEGRGLNDSFTTVD